MRFRLIVAALGAAILASCAREPVKPGVPVRTFKVLDVNSEKNEKFWERTKRTHINYVTKGSLEISDPADQAVPLIAYLQATDVNGFGDDGTAPRHIGVPVWQGRGTFRLRDSRTIAEGQAHPGAPRYEFSVVGYESLLPGKILAEQGTAAAKPDTSGVLAFELRQDAVRLVEQQNPYSTDPDFLVRMAGSLRLRDPALQSRTFQVQLRITTETHSDPAQVGNVDYESVFVIGGEGKFDIIDFARAKPETLPTLKVDIFGVKELAAATLAK